MAKEEIKETKIGKVKILYNGPAGWDINLVGRGKMSVRPGETVEFDPTVPTELRALLTIVRDINAKRGAREVIQPRTPEGHRPHELIPRWTFIDGTEKNLPELLQKYHHTPSDLFTNDEIKVLLSICPNFLEPSTILRKK